MAADAKGTVDLGAKLAQWAEAGLLSADQAAEIARWERQTLRSTPQPALEASRSGSAHRRSIVVEALAYLGGAVILAALVVATAGYWPELARSARIAIPLSATVALLLAGVVVPDGLGALASRLRGVLWLLALATLGVVLAVVTDVPSITGSTALLVVTGALTVASLVLWLVHPAIPQQLATFIAVEMLAVAVATRAGEPGGSFEGVSLTIVALAWGVATWYGLFPGVGHRSPGAGGVASGTRPLGYVAQRRVGFALAAAGTVVGGVVLAAQQQAPWLGVVPAVLVVAAAVALADLIVLSIGAVGTLVVLPMVVHSYVESVLSMALVLLVSGAVLVAVAVWVARRRHAPR